MPVSSVIYLSKFPLPIGFVPKSVKYLLLQIFQKKASNFYGKDLPSHMNG